MLNRRIISAAIALIGSAIALIAGASKTKDEILQAENSRKNRTYHIKKEERQ